MQQATEALKSFFDSGQTLPYQFRIKQLKKLKQTLIKEEKNLLEGIKKDLNKSAYETQMSELILIYQEINTHLKHLKSWMKPRRIKSSLLNFPSKDYIYTAPYGHVLIISPWNYPILLTFLPLIGAISAGNTVALKPSEFAVHTSKVIENIIKTTFHKNYIKVFQGDYTIASNLTKLKWDKIFFTGSTAVGKKVYAAAAQHLTPVTLELGGKSPCVIFPDAPLQKSVQRIFLGKYMNAGQTCIAPDFVWINEAQAKEFIQAFNHYATQNKKGMSSIINEQQLLRLKNLLPEDIDYQNQPFAFLIDDWDAKIMKEEIFGPFLPVLTYSEPSEILEYQKRMEHPLAFYVFTKDINLAKNFLKQVQCGGAVINDVLLHIVNHRLPFGGVGNSGIGHYHGKFSYDCFSYLKPIVIKTNWKDFFLKQPPFTDQKKRWLDQYLNWIKK